MQSVISFKGYCFCKLLLLSILCHFQLYAQNAPTKIEVVKKKNALFIVQNGQTLRFKKLVNVLSVNPAAYSEIKIAKRYRLASTLISWPGVILIGLFSHGLITGHLPNALPVGVGVALITTSLPLQKKKAQHILKAIDLYNKGIE